MKKLVRNKSRAILGGVCAGFAEHFNLDISLVRLLTAIIAILTAVAPALLIYLVAWIIIPEK